MLKCTFTTAANAGAIDLDHTKNVSHISKRIIEKVIASTKHAIVRVATGSSWNTCHLEMISSDPLCVAHSMNLQTQAHVSIGRLHLSKNHSTLSSFAITIICYEKAHGKYLSRGSIYETKKY